MDRDSTSTRRRLLQAGAAVATVSLSGCIEEVGSEFPPNRKWPVSERVPDLPVEERTDVLEERIEDVASTEITDLDAFEEALSPYALEIEEIARERDVLTVEFINTERREEGTLHHVAPIAGGYASLIESGYDSVALGITVLDAAPASFGSASIETAWAERYNAGELSAAEYGELVETTIESDRHPPEVGVSPDE